MSKEVKRWSHHATWEGSQIVATIMVLRDDGQFVSWDDYETLRLELAEANADFVRIANERESLRAEREMLKTALDDIGGLSRALRHGGPDLMDLQDLSNALEEAIDIAHDAISALQGGDNQ